MGNTQIAGMHSRGAGTCGFSDLIVMIQMNEVGLAGKWTKGLRSHVAETY